AEADVEIGGRVRRDVVGEVRGLLALADQDADAGVPAWQRIAVAATHDIRMQDKDVAPATGVDEDGSHARVRAVDQRVDLSPEQVAHVARFERHRLTERAMRQGVAQAGVTLPQRGCRVDVRVGRERSTPRHGQQPPAGHYNATPPHLRGYT